MGRRPTRSVANVIAAIVTALAGGFGAVARYGLELALTRRLPHPWIRLLVINVSGSALLGLVSGLAAGALLTDDLAMVLGAGLLGGYTTFSAASLASVRLANDRRWSAALASSLGMLVASTVAAGAGLMIGLSL